MTARAAAARAEAARAEAVAQRAAQDALRTVARAAKIAEAQRLCETALAAARTAQQAANQALSAAESAVDSIRPRRPSAPSPASIKAAALARAKALLAQSRAQVAGLESCVRNGARRARDTQAALASARRYEARAKRVAAQARRRANAVLQ